LGSVENVTFLKLKFDILPLFLGFFKNMFYFVLFFAVLEFGLRTYTVSHSTSHIFVIVFFKIGSHKLFAQASFELFLLSAS
jgi:hypothetical protein